MKVVCVVQARVNSTRLPRKVLLEAAGHPLLWHMLERIKRAKRVDHIVVTTPVSDVIEISRATPKDIPIDPWLGDENDLVGRHLSAATWANADIVVRIPSDNVCVEPEYIDEIVRIYMNNCQPFYSNTTTFIGETSVDGLGAEVFSISRLKWLDQITKDHPDWREHPHKYFYDHGPWLDFPVHLRLDVNTMDDYLFIKDIYDALYPTNPHFTITDILAYLESKKVPA